MSFRVLVSIVVFLALLMFFQYLVFEFGVKWVFGLAGAIPAAAASYICWILTCEWVDYENVQNKG